MLLVKIYSELLQIVQSSLPNKEYSIIILYFKPTFVKKKKIVKNIDLTSQVEYSVSVKTTVFLRLNQFFLEYYAALCTYQQSENCLGVYLVSRGTYIDKLHLI